jgi:tRNA-dihydrouridine synthase
MVKEMYRSAPRYGFIARAVAAMSCPVLANGNIYSARKAGEVLALTGGRPPGHSSSVNICPS